MREIRLTQGRVALVDDEDFEILSHHKWYAAKGGNTFYATRNITVDGKRKTIRMQWEVMGGKSIDHIDGDGLNNTRSNLRFCTQGENTMNRRKQENASSIYKGVSYYKPYKNWKARIIINRKEIHLGYFDTEIEAAKAYNAKAVELFLEFANLNNVN